MVNYKGRNMLLKKALMQTVSWRAMRVATRRVSTRVTVAEFA
jgi:hypothetical protein